MIHSRMFEALRRFYPASCTIEQATETQDAAGQPVVSWGAVAGHVGLACRLSPNGGGERKALPQVYLVASHVVELAGYYPGIGEKMRAVVDGKALDILLVEHDGNRSSTKLVCQEVR